MARASLGSREKRLASALANGNRWRVEKLLQRHPRLAQRALRPDGATALHVACELGDCEAAYIVLRRGSQPRELGHLGDENDTTPCHLAATWERARPSLFRLVARKCPGSEARENVAGLTALDIAQGLRRERDNGFEGRMAEEARLEQDEDRCLEDPFSIGGIFEDEAQFACWQSDGMTDEEYYEWLAEEMERRKGRRPSREERRGKEETEGKARSGCTSQHAGERNVHQPAQEEGLNEKRLRLKRESDRRWSLLAEEMSIGEHEMPFPTPEGEEDEAPAVLTIGAADAKKVLTEEVRRWHPDKIWAWLRERVKSGCEEGIGARVNRTCQALAEARARL